MMGFSSINKQALRLVLILSFILPFSLAGFAPKEAMAYAGRCAATGDISCKWVGGRRCPGGYGCSPCASNCVQISSSESRATIRHITDEFLKHRQWMVNVVFQNHLLPALMLFTEQMTAMAMNQVMVIGALLDAKQQLEVQRLFQTMTAQAHKDYQPSEGMCVFGTISRSLAASDRNMDLTAMAISNRVLQRELLSGDTLTGGGQTSDYLSRVKQFRELYCNRDDNGKGLTLFCPGASVDKNRMNKDINYTAAFDTPLTLRLNMTADGDPDHSLNLHASNISPDEEDIFALSANLYANNVAPQIPVALLSNSGGVVNASTVNNYMNIRSVAAKRSVARNSFAAIAAMKSQGAEGVAPYLNAIMREFGMSNLEIPRYLGNRPSYYAQMEVLTKKLYQNPAFYTELYDKPVNVERKSVSMQAIELMQRRDIYRSMLRSEAILSVMLETALIEPQEKISNEIPRLDDSDTPITLP